jgi:hypothetical protein
MGGKRPHRISSPSMILFSYAAGADDGLGLGSSLTTLDRLKSHVNELRRQTSPVRRGIAAGLLTFFLGPPIGGLAYGLIAIVSHVSLSVAGQLPEGSTLGPNCFSCRSLFLLPHFLSRRSQPRAYELD